MITNKRLLPILRKIRIIFSIAALLLLSGSIMPLTTFAADTGEIVLESETISSGNTIWFGVSSGINTGAYQQMGIRGRESPGHGHRKIYDHSAGRDRSRGKMLPGQSVPDRPLRWIFPLS